MFKYPSILSPNERNRFMLICETEEDNEPVLFKNVTLATSLDKAILGDRDFRFLTENTIIFKTCSGNTYITNIGNISIE